MAIERPDDAPCLKDSFGRNAANDQSLRTIILYPDGSPLWGIRPTATAPLSRQTPPTHTGHGHSAMAWLDIGDGQLVHHLYFPERDIAADAEHPR